MLRAISDVIGNVEEEVNARVIQSNGKGVEFFGIPTGFRKLDEATLGLRNNAVYVVGASTSIGKSAWATSAMLNMAAAGKKVVDLTLEMSAESLIYRLLSNLSEIPSLDIERGAILPELRPRLKRAYDYLQQLPITFVDRSLTVNELDRTLKEAKDADKLDVAILDYLGLVQPNDPSLSIYQAVTETSAFVRNAARDLDIPFISLVQLNRQVDQRPDKRPIISDIRDSGNIGQDAHAILFLYRPQYYARMESGIYENVETDAEMILAKNRQGPTGSLRTTFIGDRMEWLDAHSNEVPKYRKEIIG